MRRFLQEDGTDVVLSWLGIVVVTVATLWSLVRGDVGWALFGGMLLVVLIAPSVYVQSTEWVPPWPVTIPAAVLYALTVVAPWPAVSRLAALATVAAVAIVVVSELDAFTPVRTNRGMAVALVVMATVTVAGLWELSKWLYDIAAGTALVETNEGVMWRLVAATAAGLVAGIVFDRYLRRVLYHDEFLPEGFDADDADDQVDAVGGAVSDALASVGLTRPRQRILVRSLQVVLAAIVVGGVVTLDLSVAVNALVGLAATFVPAILAGNYRLDPDIGLTLWIAVAVVIHTLGSLWFYQTVWGWHNIAHATTGSLLAAAAYTTVRALEEHTHAISFPPKFTFVVVVLFVFSAGVFWEILEFTLDGIAAALGREGLLLGQHGLEDTMSDLLANTAGAALVAGVATLYRLR